MPVNGRPLIDYVLQALQDSWVERVFVVHDHENPLEASLPSRGKCTFWRCTANPDSLAFTVHYALQQLAEFYGVEQLHRRHIMLVPCDIPQAPGEQFNALMETTGPADFDVAFTIIENRRLRERYPSKRFRGVFLKDLKRVYSMQGIVFINGRIVDLRAPGDAAQSGLTVAHWDDSVAQGLEGTIDVVRRQRRSGFLWPPFVYDLLVKRLKYRGLWRTALSLAWNLSTRRLTLAKSRGYFRDTLGLQAVFVESREAELSGDIDSPADFASVLG